MTRFTISSPESIADVLGELADDPDGTALYAGGTELLLAMKQGFIAPDRLIDIKRVKEFNGITLSDSGDMLNISAPTTHMDVLRSPLVAAKIPIMPAVIRHVANPRVRSAGTLVGNLCFAEPHSDVSTLAALLDGEVCVAGGHARSAAIEDFIVGPYETALAPDELATSLRIPIPAQGTVFGYQRFKGTERPLVTAAVALTVIDDVVRRARVCIGAVAGKPFRPASVELLLTGLAVDAVRDVGTEGAYMIAAEIDAVSDYEASEQYRRHLSAELFLRALADATAEHKGTQ